MSAPIRRDSFPVFKLFLTLNSTDCTCQKEEVVREANVVSTETLPSTNERIGLDVVVSCPSILELTCVESLTTRLAAHITGSSTAAEIVSSSTRTPWYCQAIPPVA